MNSKNQTIIIPETIGQPFEGGFYTGKIRMGSSIYAVATAPKALGEIKGIWLPSYKSVPNATSCYDSMANTVAMAEAGSPLAQAALSAKINGFKDWCVAARDVVELQYRAFKPTARENCCSFRDGDNPSSMPSGYPYTKAFPAQTSIEAFRKDGSEAFEADWYITSTQYSEDDAWLQSFGNGYQYSDDKKFEARARLVRMILIA